MNLLSKSAQGFTKTLTGARWLCYGHYFVQQRVPQFVPLELEDLGPNPNLNTKVQLGTWTSGAGLDEETFLTSNLSIKNQCPLSIHILFVKLQN